ncbi:MAG: apolipoprotein N-acyltransferase [Mariprofundaceae bacterium]|nr:apolipoprotein N-acyltransferase [Mariprofundaceae bacterium]
MLLHRGEKGIKPYQAVLALLCGGAMQFTFSPYDHNWLALIALSVWGWLLLNSEHPFTISYLFGLGWFGLGSWWLADTFHLYGGLAYPVAYGCVALVGVVMALFPAIWGWLAVRASGRTSDSSSRIILLFPASAVLLEWLRGHLFTGLPWTSLGNLILDTPAASWASVVGVYGAAAIPALIGISLAAFSHRKAGPAALAGLLLSVALIWFAPQPARIEGEARTAALIQGNISQDVKWDRAFLEETMHRYDTLSTSAADESDILIWPEAAVPLFLSQAPGWDRWLTNRVTIWNRPLLFGGLKVAAEKPGELPVAQNGLFIQLPGASGRDFTGKHHLVPFGEYVPAWLPWLHTLVPGIADFRPAENGGVLTDGDTVFGSLICYESIFPEEARARVAQGAQVLVVVTNDAWYGRSPAAWQHLQAARVRAIETGRYLLRAANTGVSAIIAPDGSITATAPWWTQSVVKGTYRLSDAVTPYQKWGDLPSIVVACLLLLAGRARRER